MSDTLPICGRRRIPYLAGGIVAQCAAYWLISVSAPPDETGIWAWLPQSNVAYALLTFAMSVGAMFTGVMCDTVVVETSMRYEAKDDKGQIQTASRRIIAEIWVAFSQNLSDNLGDRRPGCGAGSRG